MTRSEAKQAADALRAMAVRFDAAAARAFTVLDHDQRQQDAKTLRVVAAMASAFRPEHLNMPAGYVQLWLDSGDRMLAYYDRLDMDVVYGSRSIRRERRDAELEAGR